MDDNSEHKKAKGTRNCLKKQGLMVKNYKDCLFNDKTILKSQERFTSGCHNVYTEQINKIAWSINDDKRLQKLKLQPIHAEHTHSKYAKTSFEETVNIND